MRNTFLVIALGMSCLLVSGRTTQSRTSTQSRRVTVDRSRALERAVSGRYRGIMKLLRPEARRKLAGASRALLKEMAGEPGPAEPETILRAEVESRFTGLSAAQSDLLSFCALADVAQYAARVLDGRGKQANFEYYAGELQDDLGSLSELGDMESLRLQMAMDRQSKMMATLSNLLKKISNTSNRIIQNIK